MVEFLTRNGNRFVTTDVEPAEVQDWIRQHLH
jgi:hypothetical protein